MSVRQREAAGGRAKEHLGDSGMGDGEMGDGVSDQAPEISYSLLFRSNPQPMWVYDVATLELLDVNEAAVAQYGYSRKEFLTLDIEALRPPEDVPALREHLRDPRPAFSPADRSWRHRRKDGSVFYVDVSAHSTVFEGRNARLVVATDVSQRERTLEALRQSEARYRLLAARIPDGDLYLFDRFGRFVLADGSEMARLGLAKEAIIGKSPRELFGAETAATLERIFAETLAGRETETELSFRGWDYSLRTVPITDQGDYAGMALMQNVTAQKRQAAQLARLAAFCREIVDFLDESLRRGLDESFYARLVECAVRLIPGAEAGSLLVKEGTGRYRFAAAVGFDLAGLAEVRLAAAELYGNPAVLEPQVILSPPERARAVAHLEALRRFGRLDEIRASLVAPIVFDGEAVALLSLNSFGPGSFDAEAVEMARGLTQPAAVLFQRQALEAELGARRLELERRASHDPLTGLPNRSLFYDRLGEALKGAKREGERVALGFLDLDGFKEVNDALGHGAGDRLLVLVAERLRGCVREGDTVARLGGDEFVVILGGFKAACDVAKVAAKVIACLEDPFEFEGATLTVTMSMGVAMFPDDAKDAETLIRYADTAMYRAKEGGRNGYRFFGA